MLCGFKGVRYGQIYLTILRITTPDGQEASFRDPQQAKEFVLKKVVVVKKDL